MPAEPELLPPADEYFICFDTKSHPPFIEATRVRIDNVTIKDMDKGLRLDLCDHPLYPDLVQYVLANQ
jgi:hypothetical protein